SRLNPPILPTRRWGRVVLRRGPVLAGSAGTWLGEGRARRKDDAPLLVTRYSAPQGGFVSKLTVWFVGSQVKAAGVVDMLIGLDGSFAVERVDVTDAAFRLKLADVERLRAERATIVLLVTPEFADSTSGFQRAMVALSAAAAAGDVLVIPVYC